MKRFTLGTFELGMKTVVLAKAYYSYSSWGIDLFTIETTEYVEPWNYTETRHWHLFKVDYFKRIACFQTIRADIFLFGKQFAWKHKSIEDPNQLPF